jgi:hypothetical protein
MIPCCIHVSWFRGISTVGYPYGKPWRMRNSRLLLVLFWLGSSASLPCSNDFWSDASIKTFRTVAQELWEAPGNTRQRGWSLGCRYSQWWRADNPTLYRVMARTLQRPVESAVCLLEKSQREDDVPSAQLAALIPTIHSDLSSAVLKAVWAVLSAAAEEVLILPLVVLPKARHC